MDRDDNRSPDWRRIRRLQIRACDIDEPLREYATSFWSRATVRATVAGLPSFLLTF
jgi:hypothetical protein